MPDALETLKGWAALFPRHAEMVAEIEQRLVNAEARADELERALETGDRLLSQCGKRAERAERERDEANDLLARILDHADAGYHEHLARTAAWRERATLGEQPQ